MTDVSDPKGQLILIPETVRPITPPSCLSTPNYKYKEERQDKDEEDKEDVVDRMEVDNKMHGGGNTLKGDDDKMAETLDDDDDKKGTSGKEDESNMAVSLTDIKVGKISLFCMYLLKYGL